MGFHETLVERPILAYAMQFLQLEKVSLKLYYEARSFSLMPGLLVGIID